MSSERFVVLGLAHARSAWFARVSQWATDASLPLDFVKCVSIDEVRARLGSGRSFSALVVDAGVPGVDRDLVVRAADIACATVLVDDGALRPEWAGLGVVAVLAASFEREELRAVLDQHASPIGIVTERADPIDAVPARGWRGRLVAVTGAAGSGTSTIAMGAARGLGRDVRNRGLVLLADLALHADQAMLHDARDVVPGIQELVEAHRHGSPSPEDVVAHTFGDGDPYRVLLGLRRHRDWAAVRPRAFEAALDGLLRSFTQVVADVDGDLEGEAQCGSLDVEDRNLLARTAVARADVVVVTGHAGPQGVHRLGGLLRDLLEHGVADTRLLPVVNRAPRSPRQRAEVARALADLVVAPGRDGSAAIASPLFISELRRLDAAIRDGLGVPTALADRLAAAVDAVADRVVHDELLAQRREPIPVRPGSLGSWATSQEAAG